MIPTIVMLDLALPGTQKWSALTSVFRGISLENMCFYDFCRCIRILTETKSKQTSITFQTRLGVLIGRSRWET
jgi:hypothetical protein